MLLFHGTRLDDAGLASMFDKGLQGFERNWLHAMTSEPALCFCANAPVAGRGGDPLSFAMGRREGGRAEDRTDGYIVVLDLPKERWAEDIVTVLPNHELEQYFDSLGVRGQLLTAVASLTGLRRGYADARLLELLVAVARNPETHRLFLAAEPTLDTLDRDLHSPEPLTFARWSAFAGALLAAKDLDDVERAGRRCGIEWRTPEVPHCALCVAGLAQWSYKLDLLHLLEDHGPHGPGELPCLALLPASVRGRWMAAKDYLALARRVGAWFGGLAWSDLRAALRTEKALTWEQVYQRLQLKRAPLPAVFRPDYGVEPYGPDRIERLRARLRQHDVQAVCKPLAGAYVRGALRVARGPRLLPWVRPRGDQTMRQTLWRATHRLLDLNKQVAIDG